MSMAESGNNNVLLVDGSHGEGGGQIIRNSVTLACILRRRIKVINIRANRPNPGLASQHLESILAMLRISGATTLVTPKKQDTSFSLEGTTVPDNFSAGVETTIDLITAGSCTLSIQCILPYLMCLKSPSKLRIIGGTHVMKSPTFDYLERVFLPTFNTFIGSNVEAFLKRPGYFPRGGGVVELVVNPPKDGKFLPFTLTQRGEITKMEAILNFTSKMKTYVSQFERNISEITKNIEVREVSFASIEVFLYFEKSRAGFSHLVEGRNPRPEQLFEAIAIVQKEVKDFLGSTAAIDGYLQDQLIIYMALAKLGDPACESRIKTIALSDHTTSAIHVAQLFSPENKFKIVEQEDGSRDIVL